MSAAQKPESVLDSAADTVDQIRSTAGVAMREGRRQAGALLDQGSDLVDAVTSNATELGKSAISFTKKNPLIALLIAAGVGALLVHAVRYPTRR